MSLKKYKQSGFTLIELMVVMAIMAILATAGLSAYTGYIKKARDAKRMADIHAINKIVLANMSISGLPPQTIGELRTAIKNANNGRLLRDPLVDKNVCGPNGASQCYYYYGLCSAGNGYILLTRLESS